MPYFKASFIDESMIKIFIVLFIILIINILALVIFGATIDKIFAINFLENLLPNIITLFVVIFVIDKLINVINIKKLKEVNEAESEFIAVLINRLTYDILLHLGHIKEAEYKEYLGKTVLDHNANDKACEWSIKKVVQFKGNWNDVIIKQILITKDKKEYLLYLSNLIKKGAGNIIKDLEKIYPHPSSEIIKIMEEIYHLSGEIYATYILAGMKDEINKEIKDKASKWTDDNTNLIVELSLSHSQMNKLFKRLVKLWNLAKMNKLFMN